MKNTHTPHWWRKWLAACWLALLTSISSFAAPITIPNFSFEDPAQAAGGWTNQLNGGWIGTGGTSNGSAFAEHITGFRSEGNQHLGMELNYDVWLDLGVAYQAGETYRLNVAIGNRAGSTQATNSSVYSLADNAGTIYATANANASTAAAAGSFADAPQLSFVVTAGHAAIGKPIRILLQARGAGRSHWDNIRLDGGVDTRAAVVNNAATNITASTATLNGTVTSIGGAEPSITIYYGPSDAGTIKTSWASSITLAGTQSAAYSQGVTGLLPNTPYFFRALATNAGGDSWAPSSATFTTLAAPTTVQTIPAFNIRAGSVDTGAQAIAGVTGTTVFKLYYGTTDGGTTVGAWNSSVTFPGNSTRQLTTLTGLTQGTTYFYRAYASNTAGESWASTTLSFVTAAASLPSVETRAAGGISYTDAEIRGRVTSTGNDAPITKIYWGPTDGGATANAWANVVTTGQDTGDFSADISGLTPGTTYYFRALAANAAGTVWAGSTLSFVTDTQTAPSLTVGSADGLFPNSATLNGQISNSGGSPCSVTFYWGTTDAATGTWDNSKLIGNQTGGFSLPISSLTPATTYFFRASATNATGSAWSNAGSFTTPSTLGDHVVINEINYRRPSNVLSGRTNEGPTKATEFVELYNPTNSAVDISSWSLGGAVDFVFPASTTLAAGGYVVVAQDMTAFGTAFPTVAANKKFGPWTGSLKPSGDTVTLLNAAGSKVDEVNYEDGFPWPTQARGGGSSMERINAATDSNLGGSWRSSGYYPITITSSSSSNLLSAGSTWKFVKGTAEASSPFDAWRASSYNDSTWTDILLPAGYDTSASPTTGTIATQLPDMRRVTGGSAGYTCIYLRKTITINPGELPPAVNIRMFVDDGAVIWINGVKIAFDRFPPTNPTSAGWPVYTAVSGGSAVTGDATTGIATTLSSAAANLVEGTNVICVQAFNASISNNDFKFDMQIASTAPVSAVAPPTPGVVNTASLNRVPPSIRQVDHSPNEPKAADSVLITAKVSDPDGVSSVALEYQVVAPGSYVPLKTVTGASGGVSTFGTSTYANGWVSLPMLDNGSAGDAVAGDSIYSVVLPPQAHRTLVRYRITATDAAASSSSILVPYTDDEQPNFAYFVYNGVPSWSGKLRPTAINGAPATALETYSSELLSSIRPTHLLVQNSDFVNCQYNNTFNNAPFYGTVVYDGVVYDHIQFKVRGIGSTYNTGKNKWNLLFNRARELQARDNWGRKFKETWNNMPLDANAAPWASVHRGAAGVEEAASYRAFELAGMNSLRTTYVHLRVIDGAAESGTPGVSLSDPAWGGTAGDGQYSGDFYGLYLALEPTEGNFLDERNLPDGNLYAIEGNGGDKKHQGRTQVLDSSDWATHVANASSTTAGVESWYRANEDLPALYNFMAVGRLIGNVDVRPGDNFRYYHRSSDNKFSIIPYDLDMQFIAAHHWGGSMDGVVVAGAPNTIRAISRIPSIALEYRNRCREVLSLLASDSSPNGGQIGQLIDEYSQMVNPIGAALTWADADAALWNLNPRTTGSGANTGQSSSRANFYRATFLDGGRGGLGGTIATGTWLRQLADPDNDGYSDHESLMEWLVNYSTNTYPTGAADWVRKATTGFGTGTDSDPNRQKGYGYKYLEWESLYGGYVNAVTNPAAGTADLSFPNKPIITYNGPASFPANNLSFTTSAFSPSSTGGTTFAALQWRIGEISAPGIPFYDPTQPRIYEIEPLWTSAEISTFDTGAIRIPASAVRVGHCYRVRVRHKDANGRWSYWSEPIQFVPGDADVSVFQQNIVVSEVNYNPTAASSTEITAGYSNEDFEFIELKNVSNDAIDLTDVRFTKGVDFNFPSGWMIPGKGFALVVKNLAAFRVRYGTSFESIIAGSYGTDNLSNGGEEIKLSYGTGTTIQDFTYDDAAPWPTSPDGTGSTLVLINPNGLPDHNLATSWKASSAANGNPGADDGLSFASWASTNSTENDPAADSDGDGLSNIVEFCLGGNPTIASRTPLPTATVQDLGTPGNPANYLVITVVRPTGRSATVTPVISSNLSSWTGDVILVSSTDAAGTITEVWRTTNTVASEQRLYIRCNCASQ